MTTANPSPFSLKDHGLEVRLRVTPKASNNTIGAVVADEQGCGVLKVAVTAIPAKGGANAAVIGLLAKAWRLRKTDMTISRGLRDRNKTLLIAGADQEILRGLETLVGVYSEGKYRDDCSNDH